MHRTTTLFWSVILLLLSVSLYYGLSASRQMRSIHHGGGTLRSGDLVRLQSVIDGDTVILIREGDQPATVRILGIKAFEAKVPRDAAAPFGRAAMTGLMNRLSNRPVRVLLNTPAKDARGRYLATLYVNGRDIGLEMVKEGAVLVYSVYPFPAMSLYLQEQELARARKRGLWADPEVKRRAIALIEGWQGQGS